jgi:prevent-host-death family protein
MLTVSLNEAKTNLSSLVSIVERKGERVIILKHGMAVAEIVPIRNDTRSETHEELRDIRINYDPLAPTEDEWVHD